MEPGDRQRVILRLGGGLPSAAHVDSEYAEAASRVASRRNARRLPDFNGVFMGKMLPRSADNVKTDAD